MYEYGVVGRTARSIPRPNCVGLTPPPTQIAPPAPQNQCAAMLEAAEQPVRTATPPPMKSMSPVPAAAAKAQLKVKLQPEKIERPPKTATVSPTARTLTKRNEPVKLQPVRTAVVVGSVCGSK